MKRYASLLVLSLWFCIAAGSAYAQTPGIKEFKEAEELRRKGDCQGAILKYNEAIQADRNQYRFYAAKGLCEVKLKKLDDALKSFQEATRANPGFGGGYVYQAKIYLKKKDYNGAIRALNEAYNNESDKAKKLSYKNMVVKLLLKTNNPQAAMAEVNKLKELAPDDPKVLAAEGDVYAALSNWPGSITAYEKAVAKTGDMAIAQSAKYYYGLAVAYYQSGQTEKANATAEKFKATPYWKRYQSLVAKSGAKYYVAIAMGYYKANVFDEALEYANKAVAAEPSNPLGYRVLGMVQLKKGQAQAGIVNLGKAAQNEKDPVARTKIYSSMIKLQFNNGDYKGALTTANEILAKSADNASVLGLKAQAEYQLGQYRAAIESADKAVAASPKDPKKVAGFYFTLGLSAKKAGDTERAIDAFTKAMQGSYRLAAQIERSALQAR